MDSNENSGTRGGEFKIDLKPLERRGYTFGKTIGKGSYATVMKVNYFDRETGTHQELACKFINKKKTDTEYLKKFFPRELNNLTKISHPNIIRVHSILQSGSSVFIFMRFAEYGDLLEYVSNFGRVDENQANLWFFQLTNAVKYLHSIDIAHRDLKCENVFISKHLNLKIGDFGFARETVDSKGDQIFSNTFCGSAAYAAPEICSGVTYLPKKADIWSLGIILCVLLFGQMPFCDSNLTRLRNDQLSRRLQIDSAVGKVLTKECWNVINACLTPDPKLRINADQLYNIKWLEKRVNKYLIKQQENASTIG